jgi:hypothetical protein
MENRTRVSKAILRLESRFNREVISLSDHRVSTACKILLNLDIRSLVANSIE